MPVEFGGTPSFAYSAPPSSTITGTVAIVSTLLISVGAAYRPETAGYGGRERGCPRLPSSDSSSADSSPQMYAPAPRWRTIVTPPSSPSVAHLLERVAQDLELAQVLAADVDEDVLDPIACAVIRQPSISRCGRREHDLAVLERARLRLVRVDDEVADALREEARLPAHREEGAAAAAQVRGQELLDRRPAAPSRAPSRATRSRRSPGTRRAGSGRARRRPSAGAAAAQPPRTSSTIAGTSSARTGSR